MFKKIIPAATLAILLFAPLSAQAQDRATKPGKGIEDLQNNLQGFGENTGLTDASGEADLKETVANIINIVLGLLGIIAVIMLLTAGYKWMMAGGNEQTVTEAKDQIKNAIIGLAVVFAAWIIVGFTINQLGDATSGVNDGGGGGGTTPPRSANPSEGGTSI